MNTRGSYMMVVPLLLIYGAAQAAEWVQVGLSEDQKVTMFVDTASVAVTSNIIDNVPIRKAAVKAVFAPHSTHPISDEVNWSYVLAFEAFYCFEKRERMEGMRVAYEPKGFKQESPVEQVRAWSGLIPESVWRTTIAYVCAWNPK